MLAATGCATALKQQPTPSGPPPLEAAGGPAAPIAPSPSPSTSAAPPPAPRSNGAQPIGDRPAWMRSLALPDLPLRWYPRVTQYLDQYRNDPRARETVRGWLRRFPAHRAAIEQALARERLPLGLASVAMVESGFSPSALSSRGAGGYWQFIPSVARGYGLEVTFWVDERRDLEKSSAAAAKYLADLYQRFGSWELALAGYNAGVFAVLESIIRYNTNDYATLGRVEAGLPWETTEYVPKVLAVAIVERNHDAFGIDEPPADAPRPFDVVSVPPAVSFDRLAARLGVGSDELAALNPIYPRRRTPPERGPTPLRVPAGAAARAGGRALADLRPDNLEPVVVRPGETLLRLARARKLSLARLRLINTVADDGEVTPGTTILVPRAAPARVTSKDKDAVHQVVRPKMATGVASARKPTTPR
ncbi:MAG TPA: transglycosylase SLT domain-containing protein [Polyangia bacterium]|nr:transglycosylase SLT domain-containing protein [Polyangia bacterium]